SLDSFHRRVERLQQSDTEDLPALTRPEVSGIAGTSFPALWSYHIVHHLAARHPSRVEIDWDGYGEESLFVSVLKNFLPLFGDGAYAESPVPYLKWLRAAKGGGGRDLAWLLRRFEQLSLPDKAKADLFDALKLWVRWDLGTSPATRTRMRRRTAKIFYHDAPLLRRGDVSLARELEESPPLPFKKLSRAEGGKLLDAGRDTMAVRFRELHGFTYGDPRHVLRADAGRGVEFFVWGVAAPHRLPTLAYHAALIFKNGVPAGYAESLALCERTEFGLNLFYTFRDGESAWIYARLLRLFRQYLGVTVFSIDPYQIGFHNEEGVESGAFWFYRKLGFRPVRPELARIVAGEERKLAARPSYRTPAPTLRRLAAGHILYEAPTAPEPGAWDNFHVRHIGLAVQRRMAERFRGDEQRMRRAAEREVSRALGVPIETWAEAERRAFSDLALMLALIPGLGRWPREEKSSVVRVIRAKASADEARYVRLLQSTPRLRDALIRLGSASVG
ncbi:MAG: hypothetical protein ACRD68_06730, partial [Pyrinomonadaceae bacterium]